MTREEVQALLEQFPIAAGVAEDGRIVAANRQLSAMTGHSLEELTRAQNPIFELDCSRSDVRGLDLAHATAGALTSACAYVPYVHP